MLCDNTGEWDGVGGGEVQERGDLWLIHADI